MSAAPVLGPFLASFGTVFCEGCFSHSAKRGGRLAVPKQGPQKEILTTLVIFRGPHFGAFFFRNVFPPQTNARLLVGWLADWLGLAFWRPEAGAWRLGAGLVLAGCVCVGWLGLGLGLGLSLGLCRLAEPGLGPGIGWAGWLIGWLADQVGIGWLAVGWTAGWLGLSGKRSALSGSCSAVTAKR